jgi:hypothetical protein
MNSAQNIHKQYQATLKAQVPGNFPHLANKWATRIYILPASASILKIGKYITRAILVDSEGIPIAAC